MIAGIGIDHCEVSRIRGAIERWGDRFLSRVYTEGEIRYCESHRRTRETRYAARFAAKEAATKALGTGIAMGINWREIEVVREPGRAPTIRLHGQAALIAAERRVRSFQLAITHTDTLATAVVIAMGEDA